jgi:hypothetical protein
MSAFRFVRQLSEEGFLEDKGVLRLVRIEELIQGCLAANQRRVWETPVRWIIRGYKSQLHVARAPLHIYLERLDPDVLGQLQSGTRSERAKDILYIHDTFETLLKL